MIPTATALVLSLHATPVQQEAPFTLATPCYEAVTAAAPAAEATCRAILARLDAATPPPSPIDANDLFLARLGVQVRLFVLVLRRDRAPTAAVCDQARAVLAAHDDVIVDALSAEARATHRETRAMSARHVRRCGG